MFSTGGCGKPVQNFSACGKKRQKLFFPRFPQGKFWLACGNVENFLINAANKQDMKTIFFANCGKLCKYLD
jgi:hypothetical protein